MWLTLNWLNLYAYGVLLLRTDGATTCDSNTARDALRYVHRAVRRRRRRKRGKRRNKQEKEEKRQKRKNREKEKKGKNEQKNE